MPVIKTSPAPHAENFRLGLRLQ